MAALNAACLDLATLKSILQSILYSEITENNLQIGLLDCSGNPLGRARVPTCDQMDSAITESASTLKDLISSTAKEIQSAGVNVATDGTTITGNGTSASPLKMNLCGLLESVVHDTTLSGYGTCQSPLTVNQSWLKAFILNLADTTQLIHVGSGIAGTGTTDSPLTLDIQHDKSMDGSGTETSPLGVDTDWLTLQMKTFIDAYGIHTAEGGGISGDGASDSPLALAINHNNSLDGLGTSADPLAVDSGWLKDQIQNGTIIVPSTTLAPNTKTQTDSVSTIIVGGTDATLGLPDAYVQVGDYVLPAYAKAPTTKAADTTATGGNG